MQSFHNLFIPIRTFHSCFHRISPDVVLASSTALLTKAPTQCIRGVSIILQRSSVKSIFLKPRG